MENNIIFLTVLMIVSVFATFIFTIFKQIKIKEIEATNPQPEKQQKLKSNKMTADEFLKTLEWMVQYQIIDNQTYNKIIAKSLPFLE